MFLKDTKTKYKEFVLPQGLPTTSDGKKKAIPTDDRLKADKVEYHVKGSGDKGSEKQYHQGEQDSGSDGSKQDLSDMTKEELYEKAKKQDIRGRSKMDKQELKKHLK